jgi:hypothetical protein
MIKGMTVEEREQIMLKMMPEMMKKVDPKVMMPNMLKTLGKMITLYSVYLLISKGANDDKLKEGLSEKLKGMKEKIPEMMPMMMSFMMPMMKNMMPMMMNMMPEMMKSCMDGKDGMMCSSPEMKEKMSECMQNMCPHCVENMYPAIPKEKRTDFALKMIQRISKHGTTDYHENEKEDFQKRAFDEVIEGIYN